MGVRNFMKIICRFIAEVKERAGTGVIEAILEENSNTVSVLEGLQAVERCLGPEKRLIFADSSDGSRRLFKNLLVFVRNENGGLARVWDLQQPFDPRKQELVLSSLMSGG